jgi:hypothetical protein
VIFVCLFAFFSEVSVPSVASAEFIRISMNADAGKVELVEGVDYYLEGAALVFTREYHLRRGYCCESGCRHLCSVKF